MTRRAASAANHKTPARQAKVPKMPLSTGTMARQSRRTKATEANAVAVPATDGKPGPRRGQKRGSVAAPETQPTDQSSRVRRRPPADSADTVDKKVKAEPMEGQESAANGEDGEEVKAEPMEGQELAAKGKDSAAGLDGAELGPMGLGNVKREDAVAGASEAVEAERAVKIETPPRFNDSTDDILTPQDKAGQSEKAKGTKVGRGPRTASPLTKWIGAGPGAAKPKGPVRSTTASKKTVSTTEATTRDAHKASVTGAVVSATPAREIEGVRSPRKAALMEQAAPESLSMRIIYSSMRSMEAEERFDQIASELPTTCIGLKSALKEGSAKRKKTHTRLRAADVQARYLMFMLL